MSRSLPYPYARGRRDALRKYAADYAGGTQQGMTSQAFNTNAALGNNSNVDAPAINASLSNVPIPSRWSSDSRGGGYDTSTKAAAAASAFKPVAPPTPKASTATTSGSSAASQLPKLKSPSTLMPSVHKPGVPLPGAKPAGPLPPTAPQAMSSAISGIQLQQAAQQPLKLFNPASKVGEEIHPTNGQIQMGTNFDIPSDRSVSRGFDALKSQKNLDLLNAGNEASLEQPGA